MVRTMTMDILAGRMRGQTDYNMKYIKFNTFHACFTCVIECSLFLLRINMETVCQTSNIKYKQLSLKNIGYLINKEIFSQTCEI